MIKVRSPEGRSAKMVKGDYFFIPYSIAYVIASEIYLRIFNSLFVLYLLKEFKREINDL